MWRKFYFSFNLIATACDHGLNKTHRVQRVVLVYKTRRTTRHASTILVCSNNNNNSNNWSNSSSNNNNSSSYHCRHKSSKHNNSRSYAACRQTFSTLTVLDMSAGCRAFRSRSLIILATICPRSWDRILTKPSWMHGYVLGHILKPDKEVQLFCQIF